CVTLEIEGELAVAEGFHPGELRLERGGEGVRTWAGVDREEVEVIPVPLRPDVDDVIELRLNGRRQNVLGLQHVVNQVLGFRFYLGLDRGGYGGSFLCQADIPRLSWFCHRHQSSRRCSIRRGHTPSTSFRAAPGRPIGDPFPTSIKADAGSPLVRTSASESPKGISPSELCGVVR